MEDRVTDRAYRIGQDRHIRVHKLVAEPNRGGQGGEDCPNPSVRSADALVGSGEAAVTELFDADPAEPVATCSRHSFG